MVRHSRRSSRSAAPILLRAMGAAWNIKGVRRVPYRLPELLAADPALPVFIVEGEQDADALRAIGLVATCNPGGAAEHKDKAKPYRGKWLADYSEHLRGRNMRDSARR